MCVPLNRDGPDDYEIEVTESADGGCDSLLSHRLLLPTPGAG